MFKKISWMRTLKTFLIVLPYAALAIQTVIHLNVEYQNLITVEYFQDQAKFNKEVATQATETVITTLEQSKQIIQVSEQMQEDAAQAQEFAEFAKLSLEEAQKNFKDAQADLKLCRQAMKNATAAIQEAQDIAVYYATNFEACKNKPVGF